MQGSIMMAAFMPWRWLFFALIAAATLGVSFKWGYDLAETATRAKYELENRKIADAHLAALKAVHAKHEAWRAEQLRINNNLVKNYEQRLSSVRAAPVERLRLPKSVCDRDAGAAEANRAKPVAGPDAGTVELPQRINQDLFKLAERADLLVEQCRALQEWAVQQGFGGGQE